MLKLVVIPTTLLLVAYTNSSFAVIKSSVSPEFVNGLHRQYLTYIANKLGAKLDIQPMPFARRLKQLKVGKLDILVAVIKRNEEAASTLVYLEPSYEQLASSFFILKQHQGLLNNANELQNLIIATTFNAKYFTHLELFERVNKIEVASLEQKIRLLQKKRVDAFLHYLPSALSTLQRMGLTDEIVQSKYQPSTFEDHYFVITEDSPLFGQKKQLEQIIATGIAQGDFAQIRQNYYQQQH